MGLFSEKESKEIRKAGGALTQEGGYSPEDIEKVVALARELCDKDAKGFFIMVRCTDEGENKTRNEGMMRVANTNKLKVLAQTVSALGMDRDDLMLAILTGVFDKEDKKK